MIYDFSDIKIYLKNYDLIGTETGAGYFEYTKASTHFDIFYGQPGETKYIVDKDYKGPKGNIFYYFKVDTGSKSGNLCADYDRHANTIGKKLVDTPVNRLKYINDLLDRRDKLIEACKIDAVESLNGAEAYFMYWNSQLQKSEKIGWAFQIVYCFEALKDWYTVNLEYFINENEHSFINEAVRESEIEQWRENLANEVRTFLTTNGKNRYTGRSSISKFHANELIQFYNWLTLNEKSNSIPPPNVDGDGFGKFLKNPAILPSLIVTYKNTGPAQIMPMVFALCRLEQLNKPASLFKTRELYKPLKESFSSVGTEQQIGAQRRTYKSLSERDIDPKTRIFLEKEIESAKTIISPLLPKQE